MSTEGDLIGGLADIEEQLRAGNANQGFFVDGINSSVSFERIYDGACLAFMEWFKSQTAGNSYSGYITLSSG